MNEQPEKTYREIIEEGDAQRELHRKQVAQEMNDPVFLREALELEYQDRKRVKRELAAANAEIERLNAVLNLRISELDALYQALEAVSFREAMHNLNRHIENERWLYMKYTGQSPQQP